MMKKILSALLVCIMLLGTLAACGPKDDQPAATTTAGGTANDFLTVVENGATQFKIVYETKEHLNNEGLANKISSLISTIKTRTGVKMAEVGTWDNTYDANTYEILIGNTGYEESIKAAQGLRIKDYRVTRDGNKIVIVGGSITALESAVTYFTSKIVNAQTKADGATTVVFGVDQEQTYLYNYRIADLKIGENSIGEYTIVYPVDYIAAEYEIANTLRNMLETATGYTLAVETDKNDYGKEILIGNTARSEKVELGPADYSYKVLSNGDLQINAGSTPAYYPAITAFNSKFLTKDGVITDATGNANDQLTSVKDSLLTTPGDIRIIFHNVYGGESPSEGVYTNPKLAYNLSASLYSEYGADFICMQEFNNWPRTKAGLADRLLALGYKEVPYSKAGNTPIFYNPDKFQLLKYGTVIYESYLPDSDLTALTPGSDQYNKEKYNDNVRYNGVSKMAVWGIFKDKTSGKIFALASTHLDHQDTAYANKRRALQSQELLKAINEKILVGEYANIPMIFGGDINTSYNRENNQYGHTGAMTNFENAGFTNVQKTFANADKANSYNGYPKFDKTAGIYTPGANSGNNNASIDHCLYKGNVTPVGFDVMNNEAARRTSDHLPLVVDFKLN